MIKIIIRLLLIIGLLYPQEKQKKDSTFVLLKSGKLKQVQSKQVSIEFVTPLLMKFKITDTDSMKYDIYDIESIQDSQGETIIGEQTIFLIKFAKSVFHTLVLVGFIWIIIN